MVNSRYYLIAAIVFMGVMLWLSVLPLSDLPSHRWLNIPYRDKVAHFVCHAILTFLWIKALIKTNFNNIQKSKQVYYSFSQAFIIALLYGIAIELIQRTFFTYRYFEISDILANITGSITTIGLFLLSIKKKSNF